MVTVRYIEKHQCVVDDNIAMNNARVDIGGPGDKVKYRIIKVKNRIRKPNSDCSSWVWGDDYKKNKELEVQRIKEKIEEYGNNRKIQ